jgi:hypothetical protein
MITLLLISSAFSQDFSYIGADMHVLGDTHELPPGATVYIAGSLVNVRAAPNPEAGITRRLLAGTRARVVEDVGPWVEVRVGAATGWVARELVSTMGRRADLDGDGVDERLVIAMGLDGATRAWVREGAHVSVTTVYPWPDPYLAQWEVVPAEEAGLPLLRVDLNQDSCGEYPSVWLSYQGGELRRALSVTPWADGGYGESYAVDFPEPGVASVTREPYGEVSEAPTRQGCVLAEGVFRCG